MLPTGLEVRRVDRSPEAVLWFGAIGAAFWRRAIGKYTHGGFREEARTLAGRARSYFTFQSNGR
jgi:hypothetical protein